MKSKKQLEISPGLLTSKDPLSGSCVEKLHRIKQNHSTIQVGRHLLRLSSPAQVMSGRTYCSGSYHLDVEYLHRWRLHNLSINLFQQLIIVTLKEFFCIEFHGTYFVPIASSCRHHWEKSGSLFFIPFGYLYTLLTDLFMLNSLSYFSLSSYKLWSSFDDIFGPVLGSPQCIQILLVLQSPELDTVVRCLTSGE